MAIVRVANMTPAEPDADFLATIRALFSEYRREGLSDTEARERILDALLATLDAETAVGRDVEVLLGRWVRAVEAASLPTADESSGRLRLAGWTIAEAADFGMNVHHWIVTGSNGENLVRSEATTRDEAWHGACQQAATLGMLGRRAIPPESTS